MGIDAKRGYRHEETKILGHFCWVQKQDDMLGLDTPKGEHELRTCMIIDSLYWDAKVRSADDQICKAHGYTDSLNEL